MSRFDSLMPLPGAGFGGRIHLPGRPGAEALVAAAEAEPDALPGALAAAGGLLVHVHEWTAGDLMIWDNRCTVHAATWFDAERLERVMWRMTVSGNPGVEYAGEAKSWLAGEGVKS
ncbi:TauD/TfdA family dioxygenase [Belnapia rosea]|uniref:Taurine catabolism dioxygenase TauD, TfdA family n=1 Tax=Belnapia rosea TaxID=938405 RepID=A0A1G6U424_9PROT|nr:TauD/TfdA family dioxygenase [Belnapia rosea]SDD36162.1 Taurine catabolism dioxygenase TauD, TfdA family [Belnapia rosea]